MSSKITNIADYEEEYLEQIRDAARRKLPLEALKLESYLSPGMMAQAQEDYQRAGRHAGQNIHQEVGGMLAAAPVVALKGLEVATKGPSKWIAESVWGKVGEYLDEPEEAARDLQQVGNDAFISSRIVRDPANYIEEFPIETMGAVIDLAAPGAKARKFTKIPKPAYKGKLKKVAELGDALDEFEDSERYDGGRTKSGMKYDQDIEPDEVPNELDQSMSPKDKWPEVDPDNLPSGKRYQDIEGDSRVREQRLPQVDYEMPSPYEKTFIDEADSLTDEAMEASDGRRARIPDMSRRPSAERIRDLERARDTDWGRDPKNRDTLEKEIKRIRDTEGSWDDDAFGMSEAISGPYAKVRKPKSSAWDTMDSGEMDIGEMPNYPDVDTIDVENLSPADAEMMSFVREMAEEQVDVSGGSTRRKPSSPKGMRASGTEGGEPPEPEFDIDEVDPDEDVFDPDEAMRKQRDAIRGETLGLPRVQDKPEKGLIRTLTEQILADQAADRAQRKPADVARAKIGQTMRESMPEKPSATPEQLSQRLREDIPAGMVNAPPSDPDLAQAIVDINARIKREGVTPSRETKRALIARRYQQLLEQKKNLSGPEFEDLKDTVGTEVSRWDSLRRLHDPEIADPTYMHPGDVAAMQLFGVEPLDRNIMGAGMSGHARLVADESGRQYVMKNLSADQPERGLRGRRGTFDMPGELEIRKRIEAVRPTMSSAGNDAVVQVHGIIEIPTTYHRGGIAQARHAVLMDKLEPIPQEMWSEAWDAMMAIERSLDRTGSVQSVLPDLSPEWQHFARGLEELDRDGFVIADLNPQNVLIDPRRPVGRRFTVADVGNFGRRRP